MNAAAPVGRDRDGRQAREAREGREDRDGRGTRADHVWRPVPEGVASPDGKLLHLPSASGGIDAVQASNGKLMWHRTEGQMAVLGLDDAVLVLSARSSASPASPAGLVRPLLLAAADGTPLGPLLPALPLPRGQWWLDEVMVRDQQMVLIWHSRWQADAADRPLIESGAMALDLDQLHKPALAIDVPAAPAWPGDEGTQPFADLGSPVRPWRVDGFDAGLGVRREGLRRQLLLCWRGPTTAAVLLDNLPQPGYLQYHASPDAHLVTLLQVNDEPWDGRPAGSVSRWLIFSAPAGKLLCTLAAEDGMTPPFAAVDGVLLVRQLGAMPAKRQPPVRSLRAWRIGGAEPEPLWQRALPTQAPNGWV